MESFRIVATRWIEERFLAALGMTGIIVGRAHSFGQRDVPCYARNDGYIHLRKKDDFRVSVETKRLSSDGSQ